MLKLLDVRLIIRENMSNNTLDAIENKREFIRKCHNIFLPLLERELLSETDRSRNIEKTLVICKS